MLFSDGGEGSWMLVSRFFFILSVTSNGVGLHYMHITSHATCLWKSFGYQWRFRKWTLLFFGRNNGTHNKNIDITTYDEHNVCQIIRFYTQKDGGSFILHCLSDTNFKLSISELTLLKDIVQTRNDHYSLKHLSPYTSQWFIKFPFKYF